MAAALLAACQAPDALDDPGEHALLGPQWQPPADGAAHAGAAFPLIGDDRAGAPVLRAGWLALAGADETPGTAGEITYEVIDGLAVWDGDIVLGRVDDGRANSAGLYRASQRWPGGVIPYEYGPGLPQAGRDAVEQAMAHWEYWTPIRFRAREAGDTGYVVFAGDDSGCYAYLGFGAGERRVNLGQGCHTMGIAAHEIGHVVGLVHEHTRHDRDSYVTIHWGNIKSGLESNFHASSNAIDLGPFDFNSIMLYGSYALARTAGQPTITTVSGGTFDSPSHRLFPGLSAGDLAGVKHMYDPGYCTGHAPSYGRGAGTIPDVCPGDTSAGCWEHCQSGYTGVSFVCWQNCPPGYTDDGAFCRRDAEIIGADTSACPWYDVCGLTVAPGCSSCPSGYINDGCTCRKDAHIFAKHSYVRAPVAMACSGGRELDAGLCYDWCLPGYDGVGPVCWEDCGVAVEFPFLAPPEFFADDMYLRNVMHGDQRLHVGHNGNGMLYAEWGDDNAYKWRLQATDTPGYYYLRNVMHVHQRLYVGHDGNGVPNAGWGDDDAYKWRLEPTDGDAFYLRNRLHGGQRLHVGHNGNGLLYAEWGGDDAYRWKVELVR